jgi:ABC-2 type transport system permease protein
VTRLLRSELLRLWSRRMLRVLALLAVVGIVVGCVIAAVNSRSPGAVEAERADRSYRADLASCLDGRFVPQDQLPEGETLASFCDENVRREFYVSSQELRLEELPGILTATSSILIVMGLMIGASSVGADWQHGTMATLLTWEPRRGRVHWIRALVIALVVFVLMVALQAVLSLGLAVVAWTRGSTAGTDATWFADAAATAGRIAFVSAVAALIGASIAWIGRHTAAALGAVFVYLAVVESVLRGFVPGWVPNMLGTSLVVVVGGEASDQGTGELVSFRHGLVTLTIYAAVLAIAAVLFFRARDVN